MVFMDIQMDLHGRWIIGIHWLLALIKHGWYGTWPEFERQKQTSKRNYFGYRYDNTYTSYTSMIVSGRG